MLKHSVKAGRIAAALAVTLLLCLKLHAAPLLSPEAQISLLTCSTGPELYKVFGHIAIRVMDPALGLDRVYNYGTFDFNTDNFYLKFARGKLHYWLSVSSFQNFLLEYMYYGQTVYENTFNLTADEKQRLFDFLENNYLPENRYYLYDFFFDNCATRIRDAAYETFDAVLADSSWYEPATFREAIDRYLGDHPWSHLGIDLGLGLPTDRTMTPADWMFLPEYLMIGLENTVIRSGGVEKPLLNKRMELHAGSPFGSSPGGMNYLLAALIAMAAALIVFTYRELNRGVHNYKLDAAAFLVPAAAAVVQALLWFATDHKATAVNPDLLWSAPAFFFLAVKRRKLIAKPFFRYALAASTIMLFFYIALWILFGINVNAMILPLWIAVATRIVKLYLHSARLTASSEKEAVRYS